MLASRINSRKLDAKKRKPQLTSPAPKANGGNPRHYESPGQPDLHNAYGRLAKIRKVCQLHHITFLTAVVANDNISACTKAE